MIKPTVGRVVWFWMFAPIRETDQPQAAIITYVWDDDLVNLCVLGANGYPSSEQQVPLYQGGPSKPRSRYCEWMPYQKGQAAKTDELQRALQDGYTRTPINQPLDDELREAHSEELRKARRNQAELERELDQEGK